MAAKAPRPAAPADASVAAVAGTPICMSPSTTTPGSPTSRPSTTGTAATAAGFWRRAQDWFWSNDMPVDAVMTDNGPNFCSALFAEQLAQRRIAHLRTRAYRLQTNGKAERFNRTLADEFLYKKRFRSEADRRIRPKHRHPVSYGAD